MKRRTFIKTIGISSICTFGVGAYLCNKELFAKKVKSSNAVLDNVNIEVVGHCNMDCKYCGHFSTIANKDVYKMSEFKKDVKHLSQVTNSNINTISLMGGEPLLHPDINKLPEITRKYFPNTEIYVITNGLLLEEMESKFWEMLKDNNICLSLSMYPVDVNWEGILAKANEYDIKVISTLSKENINNADIKEIDKNIIKKFLKFKIDLTGKQVHNEPCMIKNICIQYNRGKLYSCCSLLNIKYYNKYFDRNIPVSKGDYLDLYKNNTAEDISTYLNKPLDLCKYCCGIEKEVDWEQTTIHEETEWT